MSEDIRKMIDKVKNFNQFINEQITEQNLIDKSFDLDKFKLIINDIKSNVFNLDRIIVFGSLSKELNILDNKIMNVGDIDLCFNLNDYNTGQILTFSKTDEKLKNDAFNLLKISKKYYGYVDVFVKFNDKLMVRDDYANSFIYAKNGKKISKDINVEGIKLLDLLKIEELN